jgi:thiopurine S-methyltransferase
VFEELPPSELTFVYLPVCAAVSFCSILFAPLSFLAMSGLVTLGGLALASLLLRSGAGSSTTRSSASAASAAPAKPQQQQPGPGQILNRFGDIEDEDHLRPEDWARRWEKQQTGWHRKDVHPALLAHAARFHAAERAKAVRDGTAPASSAPTILVPLCGKSVDLRWLYEQGYRVVGVEIVTQAIVDFFYDEAATFPSWRSEILPGTGVAPGRPAIRRFVAGKDDRLQIVQADIMSPQLTKELLGLGEGFDAIWDRASLVAINPSSRTNYATALLRLGKASSGSGAGTGVQQLVNVFDYDQSRMHGPPFCVTEAQVRSLYPKVKSMELVDSSPFPLNQGPNGGAPVPNTSNTFFLQH